jgi:hypothetical protein
MSCNPIEKSKKTIRILFLLQKAISNIFLKLCLKQIFDNLQEAYYLCTLTFTTNLRK